MFLNFQEFWGRKDLKLMSKAQVRYQGTKVLEFHSRTFWRPNLVYHVAKNWKLHFCDSEFSVVRLKLTENSYNLQ